MVDLDLEPGAMQIFERCCERYGDKYASGMFDDGLNGWILCNGRRDAQEIDRNKEVDHLASICYNCCIDTQENEHGHC